MLLLWHLKTHTHTHHTQGVHIGANCEAIASEDDLPNKTRVNVWGTKTCPLVDWSKNKEPSERNEQFCRVLVDKQLLRCYHMGDTFRKRYRLNNDASKDISDSEHFYLRDWSQLVRKELARRQKDLSQFLPTEEEILRSVPGGMPALDTLKNKWPYAAMHTCIEKR